MAKNRARKQPAATLATLAVAVGNTSTVFLARRESGFYRPLEPLLTRSLLARPKQSWLSVSKAANVTKDTEVILGGVVPQALEAIEAALREQGEQGGRGGRRVWRFRRNLPCPLKIVPRPAKDVGDDRLAGALGALAHDGTRPWVVMDFGTALTVNAVRPAKGRYLGLFEGGLIVPGERLSLRALHEGTARLPLLDPWPPNALKPPPAIGRSTPEALRAGARWAQLHAAVEMAKAQARALGPRARIFITGGGADSLCQEACQLLRRHQPKTDPDLVPLGLWTAWRHLRGGKNGER